MPVLPEPDPLPAARADDAAAAIPGEAAQGDTPARAVPLASLEPGASGVIQALDATTPAGRRLLDLGFVPDTEVAVVRRAPLGDPVVYELRGYRICLRRPEATRVLVLPRAPKPRAASARDE
ncbi:MAG: FeoA family protein [Myxococcota bacterium]